DGRRRRGGGEGPRARLRLSRRSAGAGAPGGRAAALRSEPGSPVDAVRRADRQSGQGGELPMSAEPFAWRAGGCHCGGVRFEVALPPSVTAQTCNCSMCEKSGFVHIIVPESRFRILKGRERLAEYTFNTRVAKHLFCAEC